MRRTPQQAAFASCHLVESNRTWQRRDRIPQMGAIPLIIHIIRVASGASRGAWCGV
jgi:hypothetical protein